MYDIALKALIRIREASWREPTTIATNQKAQLRAIAIVIVIPFCHSYSQLLESTADEVCWEVNCQRRVRSGLEFHRPNWIGEFATYYLVMLGKSLTFLALSFSNDKIGYDNTI